MSNLEFFDPSLEQDIEQGSGTIALAGRAFRKGALVAACFIGGALCIVLAYAATLLLGSVVVDLVHRLTP